MPKYVRTQAEIEQELKEQLLAFRASCEAYDSGSEWEAKRIAASIYILCKDGNRNTTSLLKQAGIRGKLRFRSPVKRMSRKGDWFSNGMFSPLIQINLGNQKAVYAPSFDDLEGYDLVQFPAWWAEEYVHLSLNLVGKTRSKIVDILANQDGGRHVDPSISDEDYFVMKTEGDPYFGYIVEDDPERGKGVSLVGPMINLKTGKRVSAPQRMEGEKPILNAPTAIVRRIGWELDEALKDIGL